MTVSNSDQADDRSLEWTDEMIDCVVEGTQLTDELYYTQFRDRRAALRSAGRLTEEGLRLEEYGSLTEAKEHLQEAVNVLWNVFGDDDNPSMATCLANLGAFYLRHDQRSYAETNCRMALWMFQQILGEDEPNIAVPAFSFTREYTAEDVVAEEYPEFARTLNALGSIYQSEGRFWEAKPYYQQALAIIRALGGHHTDMISVLRNLASDCQMMGQYDEASTCLHEARDIQADKDGEEQLEFGMILNDMAELYKARGRYEEAEPIYLHALEVLGLTTDDALERGTVLYGIAELYRCCERYDEAITYYSESREIFLNKLGFEDKKFATAEAYLGNLRRQVLRTQDATKSEQTSAAARIWHGLLRPLIRARNHLRCAWARAHLLIADHRRQQGLYDEAEMFADRASSILYDTFGHFHPERARASDMHAAIFHSQGKTPQAANAYVTATEIRRSTLGEQHGDYATSLNNAAWACHQIKQFENAALLYREALQVYNRTEGEGNPQSAVVFRNLEMVYRESRLAPAPEFDDKVQDILKAHPRLSLTTIASRYGMRLAG